MLPTPPLRPDSPPAVESPASSSSPPSPQTTLPASPTLPPPPTLPPSEPTPMDNLLAVAELELELQSSALPAAQYSFRSEDEVARDVMSFDLGEVPKVPDEIFYERKSHGPERVEDDAFPGDMDKDLFESISEAHYLPELGGPHDEALLESLVEKGCEDNQILAHLVSASGEYVEEDMLLGGAPVADIIGRLGSLESPGRSSMTAAQGLLHLHHIGDHLPPRDHAQNAVDGYMTAEVFAPGADAESSLEPLDAAPSAHKATEIDHLEYEQDAGKRLANNEEPAEVLYTERVPDINETYEENEYEVSSQTSQRSPERTEASIPTRTHTDENNSNLSNDNVTQERNRIHDSDETANSDKQDSIEDQKPNVEVLAQTVKDPEGPTDLSIMYIEDETEQDSALAEESSDKPRDLTVHRRHPTPHTSPRRIEIPRAPSRESDAMQSPQPSGIPAISSPEVFQPPPSKNKTQSILDAMFMSSSPRMYLTSEVSITKQQCEPLNLGKHRKSASPTVSSCSEERTSKNVGEPLEKRQKTAGMDELYQITDLLTDKKKKHDKPTNRKADQDLPMSAAMKQFQSLKANKNFNIPDPLLIPKERLSAIQSAPGKEIPALLVERPDLRYYDDLDGDRVRDILVITIKEFESLLMNKEHTKRQFTTKIEDVRSEKVSTTPTNSIHNDLHQLNQTSQPRPTPSMAGLAEDIDAANSAAALNPMLWMYAQHQADMAACSQNAEFLKALSACGHSVANYSDLSQMLLNHPSRLVNPAGFPMMPPVDSMQVANAFWREMAQKTATPRRKSSSTERSVETAAKPMEFQSPYVHSTNKNYQGRAHSSARTSPIANNYSNQRAAMAQHQFLQGMYPGMGAGVRAPSLPMGGLNVPYYNPSAISQRSPRTQHKSPTPPSPSPSAYYANNNYLQTLKASEAAAAAAARAAHSPGESPRPRISVKRVDELRRRRDETEVGSTTPLGEPPLLQPDSSVPLWHPLFGNQKNYPSPWSWTTVTATGD